MTATEKLRAALQAALAEYLRSEMAAMTTMPSDPAKREAAIAEHLAASLSDLYLRFLSTPAPRK